MNERIQQMIYSLNEKAGVHWINEDKIKFAELIVRECAEVAERTGSLNEADYEGEMIADAIKEHFGVEEPAPLSVSDRILQTIRKRS